MFRIRALVAWLLVAAPASTVAGQNAPPASAPAGALDTPAGLSRIAGWKGAAVNAADTFRFAVLSDNTGEHVPGILERAVEQVNLLKPDFVMCTGDYVEGFEKDFAGAVREWDEAEAILGKLDAPFFFTVGNHDVPNAWYRKAYARLSERSPTAGRPWYSFDYRACHFVVFDSTAAEREIPGLGEEQWAWLAKDSAAAAGAKHIFIFEHHPIFNDRGDWMRLRKLLHDGKTTIFSGHDHALSYAVEHGIPYQALGPTGGFGGTGDWQKGACHQFAWVTVSDGRPTVAIVPLGHVLPHDLRPARQTAARHRAVWWGTELTPITRAGGETTLTLPNASDVEATYTLTWIGPEAWFGKARPEPETVTIPAGKSVQRKYRLSAVDDPIAAPPTMHLWYRFFGSTGVPPVQQQATGGTPVLPTTTTAEAAVPREQTGIGLTALFARALLEARRVDTITVDGKLDDWGGVSARPLGGKWQVADAADAWKSPQDCSATTRIGYDDQNLYIAIDVTDDVLFTDATEEWRRDGIEVFCDPRQPKDQGGPFYAPCRQVAVVLPEEGKEASATVSPGKSEPSPQVRAACRRREGGYVVELAVPAGSIAEGFKFAPGGSLRMDFVLNDRDEADPPPAPATAPATGPSKAKPKPPPPAPVSCITLSGYGKPNYRTHAYAVVTFK